MDVAFMTPTALVRRLDTTRTLQRARCAVWGRAAARSTPPVRTVTRSVQRADVTTLAPPARKTTRRRVAPRAPLPPPATVETPTHVPAPTRPAIKLKPVFTISPLQKERATRAALMKRRASSFRAPAAIPEDDEKEPEMTTSQEVEPSAGSFEKESQKQLPHKHVDPVVSDAGASSIGYEDEELTSVVENVATNEKSAMTVDSNVSAPLDLESTERSELCSKLHAISLVSGRRRRSDALKEQAVGIHYKSLEDLVSDVLALKGDPLQRDGGRVVVFRGSPKARVVVIGEGPGAEEDRTGLPFVGAAGQLLDRVLRYAGFDVERDVYVTNVVKRRPRDNRDPTASEIAFYAPILREELRLVNPGIVIVAGRIAMKAILPELPSVMKARGRWFPMPSGAIAMPVLHPAYLLRFSDSKKLMQQDVLDIRSKYLELYPDATLADVTNQGSGERS